MQRCHTYKIAVSKYQGRCEQRSEVFVKTFFFFFGGGVGGSRGACEQRIEVFVKIKKKLEGGGGGLGQVRGGQGGCELRIEVFVKIQKKKFGVGEGGVRVDVIEELKSFWENSQKKISGGRGGSGWMRMKN